MASTDTGMRLWRRSIEDRDQYHSCFKQIVQPANKCEACELRFGYSDEKAEQLASRWESLWAYDEDVDDPGVTDEENLHDLGIMTEDTPRDLHYSVWAARRCAISRSKGAPGDVESPTVWKGYSVKDYILENPSSDGICLEHLIKWTDIMLTTVELNPALKRVISKMHSASSELTPRLRRPKQSIDKAVATTQTVAAWREYTGQETGMRDLVLGHWHSGFLWSLLSSNESGSLLAASAAQCLTSYADYVNVTDGGDLGSAHDHLKLALDGMSSGFITSSNGARGAIWTATSVIRYRSIHARDIIPWRVSIHERTAPTTRMALVAALPDPLELVNLRMLDGAMLASFLVTVSGTCIEDRPKTYGATMNGYTDCRLVRLATSNVFKYNDVTDFQSDLTTHEAMNTLLFSTIVNGGQAALQFLAAISRDTDLVLSCKCDSDMHQWAHDTAMGSCVWYALCPQYNTLQQIGLYYQECPDTLFAGLPAIVSNARMGNVGSALSNDQGTFDKEWNLDSNPTTLASEFGVFQDTPFVEIALRVLTRVLPMEDMNNVIEYCLGLINAQPQWQQEDGSILETGALVVQLIHDLACHYEVMDEKELSELIGSMKEYIDLTVEACKKQEGQTCTYLSHEFCMRQSRLYIRFYDLVSKMHELQHEGLQRRRFAVGSMSLLFDAWKYGCYVGIARYAGL